MTQADPLLTIEQVARRMQLTPGTVCQLIADGRVASLDRGRLASQGVTDLPLVRESSMLASQEDRDSVRIDRRHGDGPHPASTTVIALIDAINAEDVEGVAALSTRASLVSAGSKEGLFEAWRDGLKEAMGAAVATNGYLLDGTDAVAIRLVADPLPYNVVYDKPTRIYAAGLVPCRPEGDYWKADLELWEAREEWVAQVWAD